MTEVWEDRIPHEPVKAFGYFVEYLELGLNRTIPKLEQKMLEKGDKISQRTLRKYREKYDWNSRAEKYDLFQAEQKAIKLKEETENYYSVKREELNNYEEIYQAVTASIVEGVMDGTIDPLKATRALKTLSEANVDTSKLHLRFFGEPAEIQQINTQQEMRMESDDVDILSTDFMNNQLDVMRQLINKE